MIILTLIIFGQKKPILRNIYAHPSLKAKFKNSLTLSPEELSNNFETNDQDSQNYVLSLLKPTDTNSISFSKLTGLLICI